MNPFLGWRAIRFCLQERDIFREPASRHPPRQRRRERQDDVPDDFRPGRVEPGQRRWSRNTRRELRQKACLSTNNMEIGAMIEIALGRDRRRYARQAPQIFQHRHERSDSVLARRGSDEREDRPSLRAHAPGDPAPDQGHRRRRARNKIWVGVCGEMAGDPVMAPLLLGLGVDELSAAPPLVPQIKFMVRRIKRPRRGNWQSSRSTANRVGNPGPLPGTRTQNCTEPV